MSNVPDVFKQKALIGIFPAELFQLPHIDIQKRDQIAAFAAFQFGAEDRTVQRGEFGMTVFADRKKRKHRAVRARGDIECGRP